MLTTTVKWSKNEYPVYQQFIQVERKEKTKIKVISEAAVNANSNNSQTINLETDKSLFCLQLIQVISKKNTKNSIDEAVVDTNNNCQNNQSKKSNLHAVCLSENKSETKIYIIDIAYHQCCIHKNSKCCQILECATVVLCHLLTLHIFPPLLKE